MTEAIITLEEALGRTDVLFVDMRSPQEYAAGSIPGAVNVPLLDNAERAEVGAIYRQTGPEPAKQRGLTIVSQKLPDLVGRITRLARGRTVIVYCWRGGLRSQSMVRVLLTMGVPAYQLSGGYKAYRAYVLERLRTLIIKPCIVVLHGSTGVGKTAILKHLAERGEPVIDLERLANHRGSVFGQVGLGRPATARNFDAQLLVALDKLATEDYIVVECESKRIGNVYLPDTLFRAMREGVHILLTADLEVRIDRIIAEYLRVRDEVNIEAIVSSIRNLAKRFGRTRTEHLVDLMQQECYPELVRILLVEYYDHLYQYEQADPNHFDCVVNANDLAMATDQIITFLHARRWKN